jgi:hypothetical protein
MVMAAERLSRLQRDIDSIETCLRTSGPQYHRDLQDLVNHTARLIGFEVEFGRYHGVQGVTGYDGIWRSHDLAIVVEVKTTDVYAVRTATLLHYVDQLISDHRVADREHALGLYVVGRAEAALAHLEHAIPAERRTQQLRVIAAESLLSIAAAEVASVPERRPLSLIRGAERYPWAFHVTNARHFFDAPVVIDAPLRAQLEAFQGREPGWSWAWFVQATHAVTAHDFHLLTGQATPPTRDVTARRPRAPRAPGRPTRGR